MSKRSYANQPKTEQSMQPTVHRIQLRFLMTNTHLVP
jgi:hypothetical protein